MKHVWLYAYDKVNLGDDLFIRYLVTRYPNHKFYLWSDAINKRNFSDLENLTVIEQQSKSLRVFGKICGSIQARFRTWLENHSDAIVYIGGSIFIEYPNWERYVTWWKEKANSKPMYVLGANWGPYVTEAYKEGIAEAFASMRDVCFRDEYSKRQFDHISTVRYAPDILFSCKMPQCAVKEKHIFVSLIDCSSEDHCALKEYEHNYLNSMTSMLQSYLDDGCNITLASFCKQEGDEYAIFELSKQLCCSDLGDRVRTIVYNGMNSYDLLKAIAESDYVIATRFHGVVLALAAGRPVLPIVYSDKTLHTLESIGFNGSVFDLRTSEPFSYEQSKKNWIEPEEIPIDTIRKEAQNHFSLLDLIRE